jgi:DNA-binding NarL/FixJ family response regulator
MNSELPNPESAIRIVVIDRQEMFRAGIRSILEQQDGFQVVGDAADSGDILSVVKREQPDIILLGIDTEEARSLDIISGLFEAAGQTRILVLSPSNDPKFYRRAIRLGAIGVLSKDKPAGVLIRAIERIHAGEAWLDRSMTATLLGELSPGSPTRRLDPDQAKIASLTAREREVIRLFGDGLKNRQIADRLFISEVTVHHHLTSIYSKLQVSDRLELLIYAYRNGLADLPR